MQYEPDEKLDKIIEAINYFFPTISIRQMIVEYGVDAYNAGVEEGKKNSEQLAQEEIDELTLDKRMSEADDRDRSFDDKFDDENCRSIYEQLDNLN